MLSNPNCWFLLTMIQRSRFNHCGFIKGEVFPFFFFFFFFFFTFSFFYTYSLGILLIPEPSFFLKSGPQIPSLWRTFGGAEAAPPCSWSITWSESQHPEVFFPVSEWGWSLFLHMCLLTMLWFFIIFPCSPIWTYRSLNVTRTAR